ncbi:NADP-dependent oxidoreductase [Geomicrobium sediminis]|uniref:NADPH:quinone reductase-like Zn-dependent oxidoreductase n=1 Tax=Geomicrobium sediminis TaxID=1347788 RepID=A0ABS2PD28_9BACL|nr:NADP-dependent oxidoreductase [Geomicrobium sediminis]MBM7633224.1 NADPH:quinone reductase-like Zn-dependent oxidoreductase [Geomicrobium sediminis]
MKGIGINHYGDERELTVVNLPDVTLGANDVRISLRASGVNPIDWKLREGYLKDALNFQPPLILGWDGAGVVTEVGASVDTFAEGDAVYFRPELTEYGTYAEEIVVDSSLVQPKPEELSFEQAASLPLVGLTSIEGLIDVANVQAGQRVLILGGSGGVGTAAIQMAKALGAYVTTTSSFKNREFASARGADEVVAYDEDEVIQGEFDVLFDAVGGAPYHKAITHVKNGGIAVSIAGGGSQNDEVKKIETEKLIQVHNIFMNPTANKMKRLHEFVIKKDVYPVLSHTYPMTVEGAKKAHVDSASERTKGKIVLVRDVDTKEF